MIDLYASEPHFRHHLQPIYDALRGPGDWEGKHPDRPVLVASYGDQKVVQRAGYTKIARIEHGAGQSYGTGHGSYAGGKGAEKVGLFLTPNHYSAELWKAAYPDAQVEVVGSPKLDLLPPKDPAYPLTVATAFHWDCGVVSETMSAFGYYRPALPVLASVYNVIGHGHPRGMIGPPRLAKRYLRCGITNVVADFAEVCRQADVFVADNTSALFEFAATGRPVVVLNSPSYRKNVEHGLRFWSAADVGVQVDRPSDLVAAVVEALKDRPQQRAKREAALAQVYAYRSGAAERAARVLEAWAR